MNPSASTEEIRSAYRTLAGRLHPDRVVDGSPAERALAERRMREVNEAWQVLRDPTRRREYDDSRIVGRRHTTAGPGSAAGRGSGSGQAGMPARADEDDDDLVDVLPEMGAVQAGMFRHGPWLAIVLVLGLIFVGSAYATASKDDPEPPSRSGAASVGTCVDVDSGPTTTVVPCSGPHELRIVSRVAEGEPCPAGTEKRRLGVDGLLDCVRRD